MKNYNRALDYTVLGLAELKNGKPVLAARLFAQAVEQSDIEAAIKVLEASNKHAFAVQAKARLTAEEEVVEDVEDEGDDYEADPLEEVADFVEPEAEVEEEEVVEESPAVAMAAALQKMKRNAGK